MSKADRIDNAKSPKQERPWKETENGSVELGQRVKQEEREKNIY